MSIEREKGKIVPLRTYLGRKREGVWEQAFISQADPPVLTEALMWKAIADLQGKRHLRSVDGDSA